ncbi:hypothetical protein [Aurantiacibacter gangjinensis]|uniref:hypothetical protein n=1 Tax=Aurantiacibacter gangjinensis TaxID=502682 RepID=UPI00069B5D7E|nr:hypothetical protein [Aurantiacibacter gangjinensis]
MPIRPLATFAAIIACSACAAPDVPSSNCYEMPCASLGEPFDTGEATVTPLEVLDDSRCPLEAECVTAGIFRVRALVERDGLSQEVTVGWQEPAPALSGMVQLRSAWPDASIHNMPIPAQDYRFNFNWVPHIADPAGADIQ